VPSCPKNHACLKTLISTYTLIYIYIYIFSPASQVGSWLGCIFFSTLLYFLFVLSSPLFPLPSGLLPPFVSTVISVCLSFSFQQFPSSELVWSVRRRLVLQHVLTTSSFAPLLHYLLTVRHKVPIFLCLFFFPIFVLSFSLRIFSLVLSFRIFLVIVFPSS
jgi:hypothetical protein